MITEMIPRQQKNKIPLAMLHLEGYDMYINFNPEDENLGTGIRGTGIYVKNGLCSIEIIFEHTNHKDQVWVEITLNKQDKLLCGCIYRSPSGDKDSIMNSTTKICNILRCGTARNATRLLISRDFNLSGIDWENHCVQHNQEYLTQFVNTIHDCFLFQHVKQPTRYRGETSNILDLILTNEEGMIDTIDHYPGLGKSDHECLVFNLKCSKELYESN